MKLPHKLPIGQTVVFETVKKFKVGTIVEVRPTVKRIEYTVYGEDGKIYDGLTNRAEGTYRIDVELTKMFCEKYSIKVDDYSAEYARVIRNTHVKPESDIDLKVFDDQLGYKAEKMSSVDIEE